jgi:hypothetical protein
MFVTNQGKTVLFMQIVQIIAIVVAIIIAPGAALTKTLGVLGVLVFMGIGAFLTFYGINCMVVGECNVFAWAIVGIMLIFFVFAVLASLVGYSSLKSFKEQIESGKIGMAPIIHSDDGKTATATVTVPTTGSPPLIVKKSDDVKPAASAAPATTAATTTTTSTSTSPSIDAKAAVAPPTVSTTSTAAGAGSSIPKA